MNYAFLDLDSCKLVRMSSSFNPIVSENHFLNVRAFSGCVSVSNFTQISHLKDRFLSTILTPTISSDKAIVSPTRLKTSFFQLSLSNPSSIFFLKLKSEPLAFIESSHAGITPCKNTPIASIGAGNPSILLSVPS